MFDIPKFDSIGFRSILLQKPKKKLSQKEIHAQSLQYNFSQQDQLDLISYSGLLEHPSYLQMGDTYIKTLFISAYPYVASTGWLSMLINCNHNIDISYHIEHVDPLLALPKLTRKITELESTKRHMIKQGYVVGSEITDPLESAKQLKDKILRGQEKLFQISLYIAIIANSVSELQKVTTLLETLMATRLFYIKTATFQQLDGLQSVLPRGENILNQKRNLDSSSAALTFPFVSSELVQQSGILYGVNKSNNSLVIIDRFSLNNSNSIIFAQSGSGKSYTAKVEILRQLLQGTKVIVIDPEREYQQVSHSVNGTYIRMAPTSEQKINPFDVPKDSADITEHIQDLTTIISLLVGGLRIEEKAVVDKALVQTYKTCGWQIQGKQTKQKRKVPLLQDFYAVLKKGGEKDLTQRLRPFVKGSLSQVFNAQTNINLDNRLVIFDIKQVPQTLRPVMMMIIANFVDIQVKHMPQKRILVIDEAWLLLQEHESARFIASLVRRARKYYLGVTLITQQANDFLQQEYGRAIASQSALRILMRQDTTTIQTVAKAFQLSEYEQQFLLTCNRGEALMLADQQHVAVRIVASEKEHPLLTTDPKEVYQY